MRLVVTEKPSVAKTIASVIGADTRKDGYYLGSDYIVSWCVGHLVQLAQPQQYDDRYAKWKREDLPIVPHHWEYIVSDGTKKQFEVLKKLFHDSRVDTVICATDAGREGELIFRLVYNQCSCKKPVMRLWISSLEDRAIRNGFRDLKDGKDYDLLYEAALCRAQADWLVGINASRLFSLLYGQKLHVGRVMSPTLALITNREEAIEKFTPEAFYTVQLNCGFLALTERIPSKETAEKIRDACHGQTAAVTSVQRKTQKEQPPKLYDLTTLQRDANRIYGYTAQQTLDYAQSLYEKQMITYPRTDSRFLTHDMAVKMHEWVREVARVFPFSAGLTINVYSGQVTDDAQVTDHHAIIPTPSMPYANIKNLPMGEMDILNLIALRLLCAVGDAYSYDETTVTLECGGHTFTAKGKTIRKMGWQVLENTFRGSLGSRTEPRNEQANALPDLLEGQSLSPSDVSIKEGKTTPPKHYTEDSLLGAMETAGIEDMPEDAERKGLGTPATRAGILEKLVALGMIERKGDKKTKHLMPTTKGNAMTVVLPAQLQSPLMTADWEQRLKRIEHAQEYPEDFLRDITAMLESLVQTAKPVPHADTLFPSGREKLGNCPCCGAAVSETPKGFFCEKRTCRFGIWKDNKFLISQGKPPTAQMMRSLLNDGRVKLTGLYSQAKKKTYDATLIMEQDEEGNPRFRLEFGKHK